MPGSCLVLWIMTAVRCGPNQLSSAVSALMDGSKLQIMMATKGGQLKDLEGTDTES